MMSAVLMIGDVESNLKKLGYQYILRRVDTVEAFAEVYDEFTYLGQRCTLVLYDVSNLRGSARLAKFLEETEHRVLCLASRDNMDRMTLSRFVRVIKPEGQPDLFTGEADRAEARAAAESGTDFVQAAMRHYPQALPEVLRLQHFRFGKRMAELALGRKG